MHSANDKKPIGKELGIILLSIVSDELWCTINLNETPD